VQAVGQELKRLGANALRWGQPVQYSKMFTILEALRAHPQEARDLARWAIAWEAMPREQQQRIKAERQATYQRRYMADAMPTAKQLGLLRQLGYTGAVESRLHASQLIDEHLKRGRRGHGSRS